QLGRALAAEAREREVERMPEEVHRARLPAVPARELLQDAIGPVENAPEALDSVRVVGGMLAVVRERRRRGQAEGRLADRDVDAQASQHGVEPGVELRYREP